MCERDLKSGDVLKVLSPEKILSVPDFENGNFRYGFQTNKMTVVLAIKKPIIVVVVTAWRDREVLYE